MDQFFLVEEKINLYTNVKKSHKYKPATRKAKILELVELKQEAKLSVENRNFSDEIRNALREKYKNI